MTREVQSGAGCLVMLLFVSSFLARSLVDSTTGSSKLPTFICMHAERVVHKYFIFIYVTFIWLLPTGRMSLNVGSQPTNTTLELGGLSPVDSHSVLFLIYADIPGPTDATDHFVTILAPLNHRLLGFVSMAHLRFVWTNVTSEEEDGQLDFIAECVDYVKVDGAGPEIDTICHDVRKEDTRLHPPRLIGPRTFRGIGGRLEIHIHTEPFPAGGGGTSQGQNGSSINSTTRHLAELSFTAHSGK